MKVAVMGVAGRMGQELVRAAHAAGCTIVGAVEREGSPAIGADIGILAGLKPLGVTVTADALDVISRCDGILDFTSPKATVEFAALAANARIVHVIGTTGLTERRRAHRRGGSPCPHHQGRQHEPRRQPAGGADATRRRGAR